MKKALNATEKVNISLKLKFGIMCNPDLNFPEWQVNSIKALLNIKGIDCSLLILDARSTESSQSNLLQRLKTIKLKSFFWQVYSFIISTKSKAGKKTNLKKLLSHSSIIKCQIEKRGKFSEYFLDKDVKKIKSYNLDFILRFGFGIIRGDVLDASKYGVWSYHHGDEEKYRGGPPCFWEIYSGDNITGSILQRLTNKLDGGIILRKGYLKTEFSYLLNRDQMFLESSSWPSKVCLDIINNNANYLEKPPSSTSADIQLIPTNFELLVFVFKTFFKKINILFEMVFYFDYWNIGVVNKEISSFLEPNQQYDVKWFPLMNKERFFADPFGISDVNGIHIFFEEYRYKEGKGKISYTFYEKGQYTEPITIIEEDFHLSYPYIIEQNDDKYIIPESFEANKIMIYKAVEFPYKWEKFNILIDNYSGVDSSIIYYKNSWWMFSSNYNDGSSYNLNLFFTSELSDEWHSHPQNPIKTDIRSSRSAGTPFIHKGNLYRPSMNYSIKNEGSICINKINILTNLKYDESFVSEILPIQKSFFSDKTHHLSSVGKQTLIDGCKKVSIFSDFNILYHQLNLILKKIIRTFNLIIKN